MSRLGEPEEAPGTGSSAPVPGSTADGSPGHPPSDGASWVLQAEAAARAGCSVSAVRKWRRTGVVADRVTHVPGLGRRVEVLLEDVVARVGQLEPPPGEAAAIA